MARQDRTEYGGSEDGLQRLPDGTAKQLSASERARVMRQMGMEPEVAEASTVPNAGEAAAITAARRRLEEKTNGYWRDNQIGES